MKEILKLAFYLIPTLLILGSIVSGYFYRRLDPIWKVMGIYLFICLIFDLINRYLGIVIENNLMIIPIFGLFEFLFFTILYRRYLPGNRKARIMFFSILILILIILDIVYAFTLSIDNFQSYARILDTGGIIVYCLSLFADILTNISQFEGKIVVLNSMILLYMAASLLVFLPINFLIKASAINDFRLWVFGFHFIITASFYSGRFNRRAVNGFAVLL